MSSEHHARHPKRSGHTVEANAVQLLTGLQSVSERRADHYDAVVRDGHLLTPSRECPFVGLLVVESGTPVEIKGCQRRLAAGQRGRWHVRRGQLEALVDEGGVYLFCVYAPADGHRILAMIVVPAATVAELVADGWIDAGADRTDSEAYKQLGWTNLIDPARVPGEGE